MAVLVCRIFPRVEASSLVLNHLVRQIFFLLLVALLTSSSALSQVRIIPTTTLRAETANNTSAANSFHGQSNGNAAAGNISKEPIRSLLYSGATTKVYAHLMGWFGDPRHMNVGYRSDDPAQVHRQVEDMVSRGIDGVMIDWRGSSDEGPTERATQLVMREAERHPGFTFEIQVDPKALRSVKKGDNGTKELIHELKYVAKTYFPSPAYMRIDGHPVLSNFELDKHFEIDWSKVVKEVPGNPIYIFQHPSGFEHPYSAGSFAWLKHNKDDPNDWGEKYLDDFYKKGLRKSGAYIIGSVFPGFNDRFASWSLDRVMSRNCGQTWLAAFGEIKKFFSASNQLPAVQIVTWNDYEEGTEVESGIENCAEISARADGDDLKWKISGRETTKENTISHYVIYISLDGENLMRLGSVPSGVHEFEFRKLRLGVGKYIFYVEAGCVPSVRNHFSNAATASGAWR